MALAAHLRNPLGFLLGDLAPNVFFAKHWEKHPVLLRGDAERLRTLYSAERFWKLERLREVDAASRDEQGLQRQFSIDASEAKEHFENGKTICADVTLDPMVAPFALALSDQLALRSRSTFAKVYASPNEKGFPLHSDSHHVFVLQLLGKKRWRYSQSPYALAALFGSKLNAEGAAVYSAPGTAKHDALILTGNAVPIDAPVLEQLEDVTLTEGDMLYLPPGCWHQAEAVGESVAISVSPSRNTSLDAIVEVLGVHLSSNPEFRRDALLNPGDPGHAAHRLGHVFSSFQKEVAALKPEQVARAWAGLAAASRTPRERVGVKHTLTRSDRLERSDSNPLLYVDCAEDGAIFCYLGNHAWTFPRSAISFVANLASTPAFLAQDVLNWDEALTWQEAEEVLTGLLAMGVLALAAQ